jgi:hypothetical protein
MYIIKNIQTFSNYHNNSKGGTAYSTLATAVEAVKTVIMFPCGQSPPPVIQISERLDALMGGLIVNYSRFMKKLSR